MRNYPKHANSIKIRLFRAGLLEIKGGGSCPLNPPQSFMQAMNKAAKIKG